MQEIEELRTAVAAAKRAAPTKAPKVDDPNAPDDLKKIRGVGPVLQKKLESLGIVSFEQIARWTPADIERLMPESKDRIRRDNWIESAREEYFKKYGKAIE
jgi:large subunit ribosomal protein L21